MSEQGESVMGRPGSDGRFGEFGGRFVPESLMPACLELEKWFDDAWADPVFRAELDGLLLPLIPHLLRLSADPDNHRDFTPADLADARGVLAVYA